jgi:hypothetical protein
LHVGSPVKPLTVNAAGDASEADRVGGETLPLAQARVTVTEVVTLSEKSFLTSKRAVFRLLTIVQCPTLRAAPQLPMELYPGGSALSVAVQAGLPVKPVTVNAAPDASDAGALAGDTLAPAQARVTVTEAALSSEKSLLTVNSAVFSLFTMVHVPTLSRALHVPEELYPAGTDASVAVQVGSPVWPVTVNVAGVASEAFALPGETLPPPPQLSETLTEAALSG